MAGTLSVRWTLVPAHAPMPWRHCPTCATARPFQSSGKIRLNANGRRLDAWLIYRCTSCDQTWNRTLFERRSVQQLAPSELDALQQSTPACVAPFEHDAVALRRQADRLDVCEEVRVIKPPRLDAAGWTVCWRGSWPSPALSFRQWRRPVRLRLLVAAAKR